MAAAAAAAAADLPLPPPLVVPVRTEAWPYNPSNRTIAELARWVDEVVLPTDAALRARIAALEAELAAQPAPQPAPQPQAGPTYTRTVWRWVSTGRDTVYLERREPVSEALWLAAENAPQEGGHLVLPPSPGDGTEGTEDGTQGTPPADDLPEDIRLNCGGPDWTDPAGHLWRGASTPGTPHAAANDLEIAGTELDVLYRTELHGDTLAWSFALPAGRYRVRLYFAEVWFGEIGQRVFRVALNGAELAASLDIVARAGAPNTAYILGVDTEVVANEPLQVALSSGAHDQPKISAIEILPLEDTGVAP